MKVSDVKLGYSILCVLKDIGNGIIDSFVNLWNLITSLFSLFISILVLITYPICYPFAKYILLPRAIKRAEKATEEQMNRMFPDRKAR